MTTKTNRRARAGLAAGAMVLTALAAGCGGGSGSGKASDAPTDASKTDFCNGFKTFTTDLNGVDSTSDTKTVIKKAKAEAKKLQDTGTPSGIPSDARKGFELFIDTIEKIDDNASKNEVDNIDSKFSPTDTKNFAAFITYVGKECGDLTP